MNNSWIPRFKGLSRESSQQQSPTAGPQPPKPQEQSAVKAGPATSSNDMAGPSPRSKPTSPDVCDWQPDSAPVEHDELAAACAEMQASAKPEKVCDWVGDYAEQEYDDLNHDLLQQNKHPAKPEGAQSQSPPNQSGSSTKVSSRQSESPAKINVGNVRKSPVITPASHQQGLDVADMISGPKIDATVDNEAVKKLPVPHLPGLPGLPAPSDHLPASLAQPSTHFLSKPGFTELPGAPTPTPNPEVPSPSTDKRKNFLPKSKGKKSPAVPATQGEASEQVKPCEHEKSGEPEASADSWIPGLPKIPGLPNMPGLIEKLPKIPGLPSKQPDSPELEHVCPIPIDPSAPSKSPVPVEVPKQEEVAKKNLKKDRAMEKKKRGELRRKEREEKEECRRKMKEEKEALRLKKREDKEREKQEKKEKRNSQSKKGKAKSESPPPTPPMPVGTKDSAAAAVEQD